MFFEQKTVFWQFKINDKQTEERTKQLLHIKEQSL